MEESLLSRKKLLFNQGSNYFRQRLALSLLSARPTKISEIRSESPISVGVSEYEVSFIHLMDKVSNGSRFKINETGTEVSLIPGALLGGSLVHECHTSRPLSYYLEPILLLAPFCKNPLHLTLKGRIQNDTAGYNSIYKLKHAALPLMEIFGLEPEIQVKFRSYQSSEIIFTCGVKKQLLTLRSQLNQDCGKVKKIRGLAYGFRVSPQMLSRVITSAKGVFLPLINDVFLTNDPIKNNKSKIPGYGIVLSAETTKRIFYAADGFIGKDDPEQDSEQSANSVSVQNLDKFGVIGKKRSFDLFPEDDATDDTDGQQSKKKQKLLTLSTDEGDKNSSSRKITSGQNPSSPEELGIAIAKQLLREIATKSRVDSVFQWLILGFMALGPKDVTSVIMGPLTPFTVQFLRDMRTFFGVTFKVEDYEGDNPNEDDDEDKERFKTTLHKLSCLGTGYINLNKTMV